MGNTPRIFTHVRPDLDALASVWFTVRFVLAVALDEIEVIFVPAFWDGEELKSRGTTIPALRSEDWALDIDVKGRGVKGFKSSETGTVHSCFASLQTLHQADTKGRWTNEHMAAVREFSRFVDVQDSQGYAISNFIEKACSMTELDFYVAEEYGRNELFIDKKALLPVMATGLTSVIHALASSLKSDAALLEAVMPIFDGFLANGLSNKRAEAEADQAEIIGDVAIVRESKEFATNGILFERGSRFVVFVDGNNLGITRARGETIPCANEETIQVIADSGEGWQDEGGEWFAHSAGFIMARGTRKAPMESPSKIEASELATALNSYLQVNWK